MKKILVLICLLVSLRSTAQFAIADIIKAAITKVIVAVDLKIQKIQNKVIVLQNAQKTIENTMSKTKLSEISDWVEQQRKQYADYFQELRKVKESLTYYHRVKDIIEDQISMVKEYKVAWATFRQDKNFSMDELNYMGEVYTGMMNEAVKSVDQLFLVVQSFAVQMTDAKRMEIINQAAVAVEQNLLDMKDFNAQNKLISIQRSAAKGEIEYVKKLYGL